MPLLFSSLTRVKIMQKSDNSYSIKEFISHAMEDIQEKIDDIHSDVKDIKEQTTKTNGRVSKLEQHKAWLWGAMAALIFVGGTIGFLVKYWLERSVRDWAADTVKDTVPEVLSTYEINP